MECFPPYLPRECLLNDGAFRAIHKLNNEFSPPILIYDLQIMHINVIKSEVLHVHIF